MIYKSFSLMQYINGILLNILTSLKGKFSQSDGKIPLW